MSDNKPAAPGLMEALPPLPEPAGETNGDVFGHENEPLFTADQMRHYARAALSHPVPSAPEPSAHGRLEWLHSSASNNVDGYEWGIYRVKWVNGKAAEVWQTDGDFSDLDAAIQKSRWLAAGATTQSSSAPASAPAVEPDMRAICEALGFDPTNHHNAAKCPYCRPPLPASPEPATQVHTDHPFQHWDRTCPACVLEASPPVPNSATQGAITDAMIDAYLTANNAYWQRTDELPKPPDKWRTGTPREATRVSLQAALAASPAPEPLTPAAGVSDVQINAVFLRWARANDWRTPYLCCYSEQFRHIARDVLALPTEKQGD